MSFRIQPAEFPVRAGIAEGENELRPGDFDLNRVPAAGGV